MPDGRGAEFFDARGGKRVVRPREFTSDRAEGDGRSSGADARSGEDVVRVPASGARDAVRQHDAFLEALISG